jgi:lipopolysaccharide export system protein LptC
MMILDRASNSWLPIGILLVLAATSFWLKGVVDGSQRSGVSLARHDPDLIVYSFLAHQLGIKGQLRQTLGAKRMLHYPDDDSSVYEDVELKSFEEGQSPLIVRANHGERLPDSEKVIFTGHATLTKLGLTSNEPPFTLRSERIEIFPDQKLGSSPVPVTIDHGADHLEADTMTFDENLSVSKFSRARVFFAHRHH